MQALLPFPLPHAFLVSDEFAPILENFDQDFTFDLKIDHKDENFEKDQEFSSACEKPQTTPVTADEIFDNGGIRPTFPVFNESLLFTIAHGSAASPLRPPLKKLFAEKRCDIFSYNSESRGELEQKMVALEAEDSKEMCKKSNSTGFSKLWRFHQDLTLRSNSDGKDAFVFLNPPTPTNSKEKVKSIVLNKEKLKTVSSSAHQKLYLMNRKRKESDKRRSFLPYRQQLVGFFANVNGFSKNLHPF